MANLNKTSILLGAMLTFFCSGLSAQTRMEEYSTIEETTEEAPKPKKAWEFGIGGNGMYMTRFSVWNFSQEANGSYLLGASKNDMIFGGQIYAAHELTQHLYLDFQGEFNYAKDRVMSGKEAHWLGMAGLGLQWRLGEYFNSKYIDPFFRVGGNYMYKNFTIAYNNTQSINNDTMNWEFANNYNKSGADRKNLAPISVGTGVNMWLNDRIGIGLQGDYLIMPYKDVANVWQGAARLMFRFGGKSKKPAPQYVERIVERERIVEKPVYIEKTVEVPAPVREKLFELFEQVYFVFDSYELTEDSQEIIERIADVMNDNADKKFLITGCTDARGSAEYNITLSEERAKTVVNALIERGVDADNLKWRGVGKRIAYAPYDQSDEVRMGDRKIFVEVITNDSYWDYIK